MSWMPLYVNDWLGSKTTLTMTNEQRGAYITLLIWQWQSEENEFESIEEMSALCHLDLSDPKHKKLLAKFEQPDGFYNDKARDVYTKQRAQFEKMSKGGRKGGLKGGLKGGVKQPEPKPEPNNKRAKKNQRVDENNELMIRIGSWFKRRPTTLWSEAEAEALSLVAPADDDVASMEAYYTAKIPHTSDYRRRDVVTLLNNWNGELDRAVRFKAPTKPRQPRKDTSVPSFNEWEEAGGE